MNVSYINAVFNGISKTTSHNVFINFLLVIMYITIFNGKLNDAILHSFYSYIHCTLL